MENSNVVSLQFHENVATIEINREKQLNALNTEVLESLSRILFELQTRCSGEHSYQECRAVILRSVGEKAFVAGADIKLMQQADTQKVGEFLALGQKVMREIELLPLPVIALVQGFAIGGGLELALACDLIIASHNARFGQAEVKLGLIPGFGGTQRLTARCGPATAKRLIFTGDDISAEEAYRLGLVDYLVEASALQATADKVLASLLQRSPRAIAASKKCIQRHYEAAQLGGLQIEIQHFLDVFETNDAKEGLDAFVNKRAAHFVGK